MHASRLAGGAPFQRCGAGPADDIVLGDTMGELLLLLSVASVVVMGGSLVPHGGHNVLEAAAWGVPVVSGPHMFNFEEVTRLLVTAGAMVQLEQSQLLDATLIALLSDPQRCRRMGAAGQQVVAQNRGAISPRAAVTGALSAARWHPRVSDTSLLAGGSRCGWRWDQVAVEL